MHGMFPSRGGPQGAFLIAEPLAARLETSRRIIEVAIHSLLVKGGAYLFHATPSAGRRRARFMGLRGREKRGGFCTQAEHRHRDGCAGSTRASVRQAMPIVAACDHRSRKPRRAVFRALQRLRRRKRTISSLACRFGFLCARTGKRRTLRASRCTVLAFTPIMPRTPCGSLRTQSAQFEKRTKAELVSRAQPPSGEQACPSSG